MTSHVLFHCSPSEFFTRLQGDAGLGAEVERVVWDPPRRAILARPSRLFGPSTIEIMVDPGANGCLVHVTEARPMGLRSAAPLRSILERSQANRLRHLVSPYDRRAGAGPSTVRARLLLDRFLCRRLSLGEDPSPR